MYARAVVPTSGKHVDCIVCLDSGADQCLFPLSFALLLGLDPLKMKMQMTGGVGNAANPTYYEIVEIRIAIVGGPTLTFTTYAGFTQGLEAQGIGLLGQSGFFENFPVGFNHQAKQFYIDT